MTHEKKSKQKKQKEGKGEWNAVSEKTRWYTKCLKFKSKAVPTGEIFHSWLQVFGDNEQTEYCM